MRSILHFLITTHCYEETPNSDSELYRKQQHGPRDDVSALTLSKTVKRESLPHTPWLRMGRVVSQGLEDEESLGSNVYHGLQTELLDREPIWDKELQGTPERVVRTELLKTSGAN